MILAAMEKEGRRLKESLAKAPKVQQRALAARLADMEQIQPADTVDRYLTDPQGACFTVMRADDPGLLRWCARAPYDLLTMLSTLRSGAG
jgi:hypothetical protein